MKACIGICCCSISAIIYLATYARSNPSTSACISAAMTLLVTRRQRFYPYWTMFASSCLSAIITTNPSLLFAYFAFATLASVNYTMRNDGSSNSTKSSPLSFVSFRSRTIVSNIFCSPGVVSFFPGAIGWVLEHILGVNWRLCTGLQRAHLLILSL